MGGGGGIDFGIFLKKAIKKLGLPPKATPSL